MLKRFARMFRGRGKRARRPGRRRGFAAGSAPSLLKAVLKRRGLIFAGGTACGVVLAVALVAQHVNAPSRPLAPPATKPQIAAVALPPPAPKHLSAPGMVSPPAVRIHRLPPMQAAPVPAAPPAPARPAWQQYALAVPTAGGHPMIAIVIDDMGIDKRESARIIGLPGPLTIAFMTYAAGLEAQARAARAAGHEIWLHVPMEPLDRALDAGPNVLKTGLPPEENLRRLDWALSRLDGYVGINNHMGSRYTGSEAEMRLVLAEVKSRGLAFLDSRTTAASVAGRIAGELGVPHIDRDVFIDDDETVEAVTAQLLRTERIARKHGFALAIGHPHATTIAALLKWLPTLKEKGFVLVPASALLRREPATAG